MMRPRSEISGARKAIYYLGMLLMLVGALSFFSTFISAAMHFGDFTDFESRGRSMALRAFGGMGLLVVGSVLMGVGLAGAAGSGLLLDPGRARRDLEPWARMSGGLTSDALDEVDVVQRIADGLVPPQGGEDAQPIVKVRCRVCRTLNDEDARFCDQCGAEL